MSNTNTPACVGVPERVPLDDIESPGGAAPPTTDQES